MPVTQSSRRGKLNQSFTDGQERCVILILTSEHLCVENPCLQSFRKMRAQKYKIIPNVILIKDFGNEGGKTLIWLLKMELISY